MRDGDESYEPVTAADAWSRLLAFFGEHLAGA
jgi:dienelactone hydrolase